MGNVIDSQKRYSLRSSIPALDSSIVGAVYKPVTQTAVLPPSSPSSKRYSGTKESVGCCGRNEPCFSKRLTIYKNVIVLSVAYFLLFSAFQGLTNLQTSIHGQGMELERNDPFKNSGSNGVTTPESTKRLDRFLEKSNEGLATYSMCAMYAALIFSVIFLPQILTDLLTIKWILVIGISLYNAYIFANLRPTWFTLIPGAICLGLAGGALWVAVSTYVTEMGRKLANIEVRKDMALQGGYVKVKQEKYPLKPINSENIGNDLPQNVSATLISPTMSNLSPNLVDGTVVYKPFGSTKKSFPIDKDGITEIPASSEDSSLATNSITGDGDGFIATNRECQRDKNERKRRVKIVSETTIPHLMGILFCFFQGGQIFGNIVSSITLAGPKNLFVFPSSSPSSSDLRLKQCGPTFCPKNDNFERMVLPINTSYKTFPANPIIYNYQKISTASSSIYAKPQTNAKDKEILVSKINMLCYIYAMMCMFAALIVALFLDPIYLPPVFNRQVHESRKSNYYHNNSRSITPSKKRSSSHSIFKFPPATTQPSEYNRSLLNQNLSPVVMSPNIYIDGASNLNKLGSSTKQIIRAPRTQAYWKMISATFRQMKNPMQILLIPLTIYMGLQQGFMAADFTLAFVSCYYSIRIIGMTMAFYGLIDAICAFFGGSLNHVIPRSVIFTLILIVHGACLLFLSFFGGFGTKYAYSLLAAAIWALGDGLLQPQLNGLYGCLFEKRKETAAFANCRLWEAVGFILSFSLHNKLCLRYKTLLLGITLIVGICGYQLIEWTLRRKKNRHQPYLNHNSQF